MVHRGNGSVAGNLVHRGNCSVAVFMTSLLLLVVILCTLQPYRYNHSTYPLLAIPTLQPDRITQFVTMSMSTHTYYWLSLVSCVVQYSCND